MDTNNQGEGPGYLVERTKLKVIFKIDNTRKRCTMYA